jgi:hypothetical protein
VISLFCCQHESCFLSVVKLQEAGLCLSCIENRLLHSVDSPAAIQDAGASELRDLTKRVRKNCVWATILIDQSLEIDEDHLCQLVDDE